MQLTLKMRLKEPLKLPLHYQHILQGVVYHHLDNPEFSKFLHDVGYRWEKRTFKLFTFSRLFGHYEIDRPSRTILFDDVITWKISSIIPEFIQGIGNSFLLKSQIQIQGQLVDVIEVQYEIPEVNASDCRVQALSPITIHQTFEDEGGKKLTQFLHPKDVIFSHFIRQNFTRKYEAYHNDAIPSQLEIEPVKVTEKDKVVTKIKGFYITGYLGQYWLKGDPKLIQFALSVGLGARNSQGFGMIECISN